MTAPPHDPEDVLQVWLPGTGFWTDQSDVNRRIHGRMQGGMDGEICAHFADLTRVAGSPCWSRQTSFPARSGAPRPTPLPKTSRPIASHSTLCRTDMPRRSPVGTALLHRRPWPLRRPRPSHPAHPVGPPVRTPDRRSSGGPVHDRRPHPRAKRHDPRGDQALWPPPAPQPDPQPPLNSGGRGPHRQRPAPCLIVNP